LQIFLFSVSHLIYITIYNVIFWFFLPQWSSFKLLFKTYKDIFLKGIISDFLIIYLTWQNSFSITLLINTYTKIASLFLVTMTTINFNPLNFPVLSQLSYILKQERNLHQSPDLKCDIWCFKLTARLAFSVYNYISNVIL
jgi:hypothetical protein